MKFRSIAFALSSVWLASCAATGPSAPGAGGASAPSASATPAVTANIAESYIVRRGDDNQLDGVGVIQLETGAFELLVGSAKSKLLYRFDASSGRFLSELGQPGSGETEFDQPRGLHVSNPFLYALDAGNRRIKMYWLPKYDHLLTFGSEQLESPQGVFAGSSAKHLMRVWAIDQSASVGARLKIYDLDLPMPNAGDPDLTKARRPAPVANFVGAFGATDGPGALNRPVSIAGDMVTSQLAVVDAADSKVKIYDLDGNHRTVLSGAPVEGAVAAVALRPCDSGRGFWIVAENRDDGVALHLYNQRDLLYRGTVITEKARGVRSLTAQTMPLGLFPAGAIFATLEQGRVAAFDWDRIAKSTGVTRYCF